MFDQATIEMLLEGVVDTLYMTLVSTFFSYVLRSSTAAHLLRPSYCRSALRTSFRCFLVTARRLSCFFCRF